MSNIDDKLTQIFRTVFNEPTLNITPETTANDVDAWDSLSHLNMISAVEKEYGIKFKLKDLVKLKNVGDLIHTIEVKLSEN
jgi:acyl carrier protein